MHYRIFDLGLVYYKNVISEPEKLISLIEDLNKRFLSKEHQNDARTVVRDWTPWSYGEMIFNYQKFFPESKDISDKDYYAAEMKQIADILYGSLQKAFDHYSQILYPFAGKNIKSREHSIHLLKYGPGGHLPAHQDQGVSSRVLSSVMYLNDNYSGGEIEFVNSGVRIKPEAGSIIFFPSNFLYVHEVYPITDGYRYSMPHWYHNMKDPIRSTGDE
jgi:Rps23 Pro-64 3,4-dihydroxylase Tpa1-like proline 4-hydroxylase